MAALKIKQIKVGPLGVFAYIVACSETKKGIIIDPGGEANQLVELIRSERFEITYILNTHGHADHVMANQKLKNLLPNKQHVAVGMHSEDKRLFIDQQMPKRSANQSKRLESPVVDRLLHHGDVLDVGRMRINVIHTPGHTPGSVCFHTEKNLFTGDTLFVGAVGRTDIPGGSLDTLLASLQNRIMPLPPDTIIWPGHDYGERPTTTLGREMRENPYITDFILS